MNRAMYEIQPICPNCLSALSKPKDCRTPAEIQVTCKAARGENGFPCLWKGWAAFYLEIDGPIR